MTRGIRRVLVGPGAVALLAISLLAISGFSPSHEDDHGTVEPLSFSNERSSSDSSREGRTVGSMTDGAVDPFEAVPPDSWIVRAVDELAERELPQFEGMGDELTPVTRYELAVVLARIIERLQGAGRVIEGPLAKVATLEKLSNELRTELDMLGVQQARFSARLSKVEDAVRGLDGSVDRLGRSVETLETDVRDLRRLEDVARTEAGETRVRTEQMSARIDDVVCQVDGMGQQFDELHGRLDEGENHLRNLGEVLSRVMVKVALADARLNALGPEGAQRERRDIGSLARAVNQLQNRLEELEERRALELQRMDSLSVGLERLADARGDGRALPSEADERMVLLTDAVSRLTRRLDSTQTEIDDIRRGGFKVSGTAVSPKALDEVRLLLRNFLTAYELRLSQVEERLM